MHGLLEAEQDEIVALYDEWGEIDRSHRKLAHRGSYTARVWVSPSTVMRVLAAHGLVLRAPRRAGRSERRPFPELASYEKNSIWIYDCTHFAACQGVAVVTVMDLVTRKWICEVVSGEETSTQVQVAFCDALELEGLLELVEARQDRFAAPAAALDAPLLAPILLAVSDNGPQMTSGFHARVHGDVRDRAALLTPAPRDLRDGPNRAQPQTSAIAGGASAATANGRSLSETER